VKGRGALREDEKKATPGNALLRQIHLDVSGAVIWRTFRIEDGYASADESLLWKNNESFM